MKSIVLLSGGVGGARLARGLAALDTVDLTIVVNVGDDEVVYGLYVSPDLDTVMYTLAGLEGPEGWGIAGDTFSVMKYLADLGIETGFRLGDRDLATNLVRTRQLRAGSTLSEVTRDLAAAYGIRPLVLPATDDPLRTIVETAEGAELSFQEYFVLRAHRDEVRNLRFEGAVRATPAPSVVEAVERAEAIVIGPSNPPLSIWPVLAIPGLAEAVAAAARVVAVSPLFGGKPLKGPADRVMASLGLPGGNAGVIAAYDGLLHDLVIDTGDAPDRSSLSGARIHVADTRLSDPGHARSFAEWLVDLL